MSTHTPGLWGLHEHMNADPDKGGYTTVCEKFTAHTIYIGVGEKIICEVTAYDYRGNDQDGGFPRPSDFEENKANARLIAAAPELLEFVEEYLDAYVNGMAGESFLRRMAEAAHTKATGA